MVEKLAVVLRELALPKLTVPGRLTLDQVTVVVAGGLGKPSSLTAPVNVAWLGGVMVRSGPALTTGAMLVPQFGR